MLLNISFATSSNESYVILLINISSFQATNQFCLNLSGKTKSSIINHHRTMAENGLHLEDNY